MKDVAMLLKAIKTVRKADQMRVAAIRKAVGVVAKHINHAGLLEIVQSITSFVESTASMIVMPSVARKKQICQHCLT